MVLRSRRALAFLATVVTVAALLIPAAAADPTPSIPPGREPAALALLAPYTFESGPAAGIIITGVVIEPFHIEVKVGRSSEADDDVVAVIRLDHPDADPVDAPGEPVRTAAFRVSTTPSGDDAVDAAAAEVVQAIQRNDPGTFWEGLTVSQQPDHTTDASEGGARAGVILSAGACLLLVLLVLEGWFRRRRQLAKANSAAEHNDDATP